MIDALDKQTQPLQLEPAKRGRGRPKTGNAMTPAQKQKAYRERQKGNVAGNAVAALDENMELRERLLFTLEEVERLRFVVDQLNKDNSLKSRQIRELGKELDVARKEAEELAKFR